MAHRGRQSGLAAETAISAGISYQCKVCSKVIPPIAKAVDWSERQARVLDYYCFAMI